MQASSATSYRYVQGLSRGLAILHAISCSTHGWASIAELSKVTGLHRTTVRRLLETLQADGYVRRSASDDSYRLNQKIRQLSDGFTDDEWISEIATPVLGELIQKVVWPSDLSTLDGDCMIVRETTHRFSPLSFHRAMIRQRMPVLLTAVGRAYLAYCTPEERQQVLSLIAAGQDEQAQLARNQPLVDRMLAKVRDQGYATNDGEWRAQSMIASVAVPICHDGHCLGSLNVVFLRKVMDSATGAQKFFPDLKAAAEKIELKLQQRAAKAPVNVDNAVKSSQANAAGFP